MLPALAQISAGLIPGAPLSQVTYLHQKDSTEIKEGPCKSTILLVPLLTLGALQGIQGSSGDLLLSQFKFCSWNPSLS